MLQLKRVEIHGFKSFADRTELLFEGTGIAGVVGPNGCGKSNVADAISWVLGEQSAKTLRGGRMQDVIFAGTRERKPLGMAAVTITLVDPEYREDGPAPIEKVEALEKANGQANGHANGHTNGHANGHANGHTNGHENGHGVKGHSGDDADKNAPEQEAAERSGEARDG